MAGWRPPAFRTTEEFSEWAYKYVRRLAKVVTSLSIAATVIRFVQLALMAALSLAYATGSPGVYHDVLVWDKNASAPFEVTVYRNLTSWTVVHDRNLSQSGNTIISSFVWTRDSEPGCVKYSCNDTRYNCSGDRWQSSRIGYGDSPGFGGKDEYPNHIYVIDRAVFGLIVVVVSSSASGFTTAFEARNPDTLGFLRFIASIDFIFSLGYIAIGVVPLFWSQELELLSSQVKLKVLRAPRRPPHGGGVKVVVGLGWLIGQVIMETVVLHHYLTNETIYMVCIRVLYITQFIIDIFLITKLGKLAPVAKLPGGRLHQPRQQGGEFGPQATAVTRLSSSEWTGSAQSASTTVRRVPGGLGNPELV
ncbi:unnamed protein product [Tuber aestivum]|uniref:Uncharacterized protein n=1 Tax=Tuber aestivum TaxID=59557 RepID=A0A292PUC6_9PEZI|nr:unnamed protein product [Tuber aestivum]